MIRNNSKQEGGLVGALFYIRIMRLYTPIRLCAYIRLYTPICAALGGGFFHTVGNSKNAKTDGTREWRGTVGNGENAKTHGTVSGPDSDFLPWVTAKVRKPTVRATGCIPWVTAKMQKPTVRSAGLTVIFYRG